MKNQSLTTWEVFTDEWNSSYVFCPETKSYAYFINDGSMFYFTDFEGSKKSLLFHFYLAAYRQLLGYYEEFTAKDNVPVIHFNSKWIQWLQDFVAPFYLFTKANYISQFVYTDNLITPQIIKIKSGVEAKFIDRTFRKINFEMELKDNKIQTFSINHKGKTDKYLCVS